MNRFVTPVAFLTVFAFLTGCQTPLLLAPTPEVLKDEQFNLFDANPEPLTTNELATLYVTTRTAGRTAQ